MQPIVFCTRCRGMKAGWNSRYVMHRLTCEPWLSKSSKLLILTVLLSTLVFAFQTPNGFIFPINDMPAVQQATAFEAPAIFGPMRSAIDPAVRTIDALLKRYQVEEAHRGRVAESIVSSARKYNLDPKLVASISMVESRANPFAISEKDSIGVMQIHLPTWGHTADREGVNLFKIEDNIDFGARILKNYVRQFGLWEGVKRYKGWNPDSPESLQSVEDYLAKVQHIYDFERPPEAEVLQ